MGCDGGIDSVRVRRDRYAVLSGFMRDMGVPLESHDRDPGGKSIIYHTDPRDVIALCKDTEEHRYIHTYYSTGTHGDAESLRALWRALKEGEVDPEATIQDVLDDARTRPDPQWHGATLCAPLEGYWAWAEFGHQGLLDEAWRACPYRSDSPSPAHWRVLRLDMTVAEVQGLLGEIFGQPWSERRTEETWT